MLDIDKDGFSSLSGGLRGDHWRGKDCNDNDDNIYPGRKIPSGSNSQDYNCNGISGTNSDGVAYKDLYCKNS